MTMDITITLRDPRTDLPPLNRDILAVVESSLDRGYGFQRRHDLRVLRILPQDIDGDEDEGAAIYAELERGETKWEVAQLLLEAGIDEIDDFYSDSIVWWAEMPQIPASDERDDEE